jgi:uncharacterized protein YndB with AHSA1/START domain
MVTKILAVLAVVVILLVGFAAMQPDSFRVDRAVDVKAPPEKVFPLINDFHNWPKWSPWEKMDPDMVRVLSGAEKGQGAVYSWKGNKKVGSGRMDILESSAPARVLIQLDFIEPFSARNTVEFTLTPVDGGTHVNWAMYGPSNLVSKMISLFCSMDKMIGKDFEAGLAAMAAAAEKMEK